MKERFLATILALCMVLSLCPATALAADVNFDKNGTILSTAADDAQRDAILSLGSDVAPLAESEDNLPQLSDPIGLTWNANGAAHWEINGRFQNQYEIKFYRVGESEAATYTTVTYGGSTVDLRTVDDWHFIWHCVDGDRSLEDGDYYFTVQNLGDGISYKNSNVVSSQNLQNGLFSYKKPADRLAAVQKGIWEWPAATWEDNAENTSDKFDSYDIDYGFSKSARGEIEYIGGSYVAQSGQEDSWLQDKLIGENGNGYYYFRVRPISKNILQWQNGDYSPWSDGYNLTEASGKIENSLTGLLDKDGPSEIIQGVQNLNKTELANAMRTDRPDDSNGTIAALKALEDKIGISTSVNITDSELQDVFPQDSISVVGASLNDRSNLNNNIALNVGHADPKDIREEMYDNTVAVNFSMDLDNVPNTHQLQVPVKITMPVPANINPDFLVILHYHSDQQCEEVFKNLYQENGQWFVSFVLDSFSDFVITQKKTVSPAVRTITFNPNGGIVTPTTAATNEAGTLSTLPIPTRDGYTFDGWYTAADGGEKVDESRIYMENITLFAHWTLSSGQPGDLNSDGKVTMADVIRLARGAAGYVTLTEQEQAAGDVTGDGKITMADVIRVARYAAGYSTTL